MHILVGCSKANYHISYIYIFSHSHFYLFTINLLDVSNLAWDPRTFLKPSLLATRVSVHFTFQHFWDRAERHDFWPRLCLLFSSFLFPPKKRGKKKRTINSKNSDQKSHLSARSVFGITGVIDTISVVIKNSWSKKQIKMVSIWMWVKIVIWSKDIKDFKKV